MPRFNQIVLALAALAAAGLLGWQLLGKPEPETPTVRDEAAGTDYYVTGARLLQTDARGRPEYRATAVRMTHHPDDDVWLLQQPTMVLYTETGEPWRGEAERGRIWADGDEALLLGEVRLWRPRSPTNQEVVIDTSEVYLRPPQKYAETAAPVLVRQEKSRLTGVGAQVFLDEERYVLLSEVRGLHVPPSE